jgi:hypothetical protein
MVDRIIKAAMRILIVFLSIHFAMVVFVNVGGDVGEPYRSLWVYGVMGPASMAWLTVMASLFYWLLRLCWRRRLRPHSPLASEPPLVCR